MKVSKKVDHAGKRYGRLVAIAFEDYYITPSSNKKNPRWKFLCDCGNVKITVLRDVLGGKTQSCGCYRREFARQKFTLSTELQGWSFYITHVRSGAKRRGLCMELSDGDIIRIASQNCHYCGLEPQLSETARTQYIARHKDKDFTSNKDFSHLADTKVIKRNGIDRYNNDLGYTINNSVPCCHMCNMGKGRYTAEQWISWLKRIAVHQHNLT